LSKSGARRENFKKIIPIDERWRSKNIPAKEAHHQRRDDRPQHEKQESDHVGQQESVGNPAVAVSAGFKKLGHEFIITPEKPAD
jgi:hypothetical protein